MNFLTIAIQAEEFFNRCIEQKADTLEARLRILEEMANERKVFKQTNEQVIKRLKGKKALYVRSKRKNV